ncbi:MAG: SpaA isopeptide-forming pilin-related protein, partial [Oxalobacter sp.]
MRTNRITRLLVFCFALLMLISMVNFVAIDVSAEALPAADWTGGSIQVSLDNGENDSGNVTVTAYKLVSVHTSALQDTDPTEYQPQMPVYTWESGIASWIRTNYPAYIGPDADGDNPADNSVQEVFSTEESIDAAVLAEFYAKIEANIVNNTIVGLTSTSVTASADGTTSITNLTMGVYLVTATGGTAVYRPTVAIITPESKDDGTWIITNPAAVTLKSSPVALVKTITDVNDLTTNVVSNDAKRAVAGIGDTVSFKLEVDVPEYPSQSVSKKFTITDTVPSGLTLKQETIKVVDQNNNEINIPSELITATEQGLTINLDNSDLIEGKTKLTVTYDAVLNSSVTLGTTGNVNTAVLTYSNNPYVANNSKTTTDTATVFTFGIEVIKIKKGTEESPIYLSGAEFELKDENGAKISVTSSNGVYVKDANGKDVPTTDDSGKLIIQGLAPGTYTLKETKAPNGYVLPSNETSIEIEDDNINGIIDSKESSTTDEVGTNPPASSTDDDGLFSITIENTLGFTLPQTGGIGTVLFSMI